MTSFMLPGILVLIATTLGYPSQRTRCLGSYPFPFVSRIEWGANPPRSIFRLNTPVPFVVIHHSSSPAVCMNRDACVSAMRSMQNYHQGANGWVDIGYNFAIGGEGSVYEGRGWEAVGAHAVGYNVQSIGIVLIGDWVSTLPPRQQMDTAKRLIDAGVTEGYIRPDYRLIGHRQVSATECPGETLFREISTWEHFVAAV